MYIGTIHKTYDIQLNEIKDLHCGQQKYIVFYLSTDYQKQYYRH